MQFGARGDDTFEMGVNDLSVRTHSVILGAQSLNWKLHVDNLCQNLSKYCYNLKFVIESGEIL